jgi:hypothetical protein
MQKKAWISLLLFIFPALSLQNCASGGFKLTRQYAGWVNSQNLILRIILYILTSVVFAVTLLIDAVIFNTMDFWNGRVSQGTYEFEKEGKKYVVTHSYHEQGLRQSIIQVSHSDKTEVILIKETAKSTIELWQNGTLTGQVENLDTLPVWTSKQAGQSKLLATDITFLISKL